MQRSDFILIGALILLTIAIFVLSKGNFTASTGKPGKTEVIVILMDGCPHCERMKKAAMDAQSETAGKLKVLERKDPEAQQLVKKHSISGFPAIIDSNGTPLKTDRTKDSLVELTK